MSKISKGIFIIGTDTDVGKSVITAGLVYLLRNNGYNACSFKAVQSGGVKRGEKLVAEDVELVKQVCNLTEKQENMVPYCLEPAVSPHLAARLTGVEIKKEKIIEAYNNLAQRYEYIIAEGSGGLVVPLIKNDYFIYDLVKDLNLPVVIVSRAGVGTINHTVLTVEYCYKLGFEVKGIFLNRYTGEEYEKDNIRTIENLTGQKVLSIADIKDLNHNYDKLKDEFESKFDIKNVINMFEN